MECTFYMQYAFDSLIRLAKSMKIVILNLIHTAFTRVSDSDDLLLPVSEVGNLAVNIEKAIYNMYNSTDSRYKNKYRLMMFNLKDPKNKVS